MTKLLLTGDNHIGQGRDLAPDRLAEQEAIWRETLSLSRQEGCDAVLHGGDLWERRKPTPDEYLAAERPLVEHKNAHRTCPVFVVAGNHDRSGVDDNLALRVLEQAGLIRLSTDPEMFIVMNINSAPLGTPGLMLCTLPWTPVSRLVAAGDGGDRDRIFQDASDLLIRTAKDLRAQVDGPAILALHWSVSGASLPSGLPIELAREVILPLAELEQLGFDAIVCGHIHRNQVLSYEPPIFYVGSPMPLNFGEKGANGVWSLDTDRLGVFDGMNEWRPLESRRFVTLDCTAESASLAANVTTAQHGAFVKVRGPQGLVDVQAVRDAYLAAGAARVWFDLETVRETRARGQQITPDQTEQEAFNTYLNAIGVNGSEGAALTERMTAYLSEARA